MKEYLDEKLHEECGVFGMYDRDGHDVVATAYYALYALQHRGQESCGIAVNDGGVIYKRRELGLVNEVFTKDVLDAMPRGQMCIGHCRYATTGTRLRANAQPFVIRHVKGPMAIAHNGNLTNSAELREEFELAGGIFQSTSDTEVIAYTITKERLSAGSIEQAVERAMDKLQGAYSLVVMSPRKLIAARDPYGYRPLCIGRIGGSDVIASESCAILAAGGEFVRDVEPGEIVMFNEEGMHSIKTHCGGKTGLCVFEFVYFARPDSVIDGASVHRARRRAGAFLALEHPVQADVVVGVPDSGLDAALGYSQQSGIPYGMGFIKNKYIGRTFISPTQSMRENEVNIKLNPIRSVVEGKRVVLIDDSIVRGTTCRRTIDLLRRAGAKEIHMRVSAPPFVAACYYGTDIDDPSKLIANNHSVEEIAKIIGVDSLGYLSLQDVVKLADNTEDGFCTACFGGGYPTSVPKDGGKDRFECKISEKEKQHA